MAPKAAMPVEMKAAGKTAGRWNLFGAKKAPVQAKLGEESTMYYNEELKRWVERGKEAEAVAEAATAAPPKMATTSVLPGNTARRAVNQRYVLQSNLAVNSNGPASSASAVLGVPPTSTGSLGINAKFFVPGQEGLVASAAVPSIPAQSAYAAPSFKPFEPKPAAEAPIGSEVSSNGDQVAAALPAPCADQVNPDDDQLNQDDRTISAVALEDQQRSVNLGAPHQLSSTVWQDKDKHLWGVMSSMVPASPEKVLAGANQVVSTLASSLVARLPGQRNDDTLDFEDVMHPGSTQKLDGPLPWELPDPLKHSDQFISYCTNWQKQNPGVPYSHDLLLASLTEPPPPPPPAVAASGSQPAAALDSSSLQVLSGSPDTRKQLEPASVLQLPAGGTTGMQETLTLKLADAGQPGHDDLALLGLQAASPTQLAVPESLPGLDMGVPAAGSDGPLLEVLPVQANMDGAAGGEQGVPAAPRLQCAGEAVDGTATAEPGSGHSAEYSTDPCNSHTVKDSEPADAFQDQHEATDQPPAVTAADGVQTGTDFPPEWDEPGYQFTQEEITAPQYAQWYTARYQAWQQQYELQQQETTITTVYMGGNDGYEPQPTSCPAEEPTVLIVEQEANDAPLQLHAATPVPMGTDADPVQLEQRTRSADISAPVVLTASLGSWAGETSDASAMLAHVADTAQMQHAVMPAALAEGATQQQPDGELHAEQRITEMAPGFSADSLGGGSYGGAKQAEEQLRLLDVSMVTQDHVGIADVGCTTPDMATHIRQEGSHGPIAQDRQQPEFSHAAGELGTSLADQATSPSHPAASQLHSPAALGLEAPPGDAMASSLLSSTVAVLEHMVAEAREGRAVSASVLQEALPLVQLCEGGEVSRLLSHALARAGSAGVEPGTPAKLVTRVHMYHPGALQNGATRTLANGVLSGEGVHTPARHSLFTLTVSPTSDPSPESQQGDCRQSELEGPESMVLEGASPEAPAKDVQLRFSGTLGSTRVAGVEEVDHAAQLEFEAKLAAIKHGLEEDFEARLAAKDVQWQQKMATLHQDLANEFEKRMAAMEEELMKAREESMELGQELDELMACLGMSEAKCDALNNAMAAAGLDFQSVCDAVESQFTA